MPHVALPFTKQRNDFLNEFIIFSPSFSLLFLFCTFFPTLPNPSFLSQNLFVSFFSPSFSNLGGESLHLAQLLELWKEKNAGHCSRLIVILDTENSLPWVKEARRVEGIYVAVQGAELLPTNVDPETGDVPFLGDFTSEWVEFSCNPHSDIQWSERGKAFTAIYGVSKRWSDYTLHLPTGSDVAKHWKTHFPKATYPMVHLSNWCCGLNLFWLCSVCLRCFRRCKLAWFPPAVLDTGQGIKLVHS